MPHCAALRLELGELTEVIFDAVAAAAIPAGPERGLGDRDAAGQRHLLVVVGGPRDHVRVMIDVFHDYPCFPLARALRALPIESRDGLGRIAQEHLIRLT
jgi:hypothetical protein